MSASIATIYDGMALAPEATSGEATPALVKMRSWGVTITPQLTTTEIRPRGESVPAEVVPNMESVTAAIEGWPTYTELVYLLDSNIGAAEVTAVAGSSGAFDWLYLLPYTQPSAPQAYSVEVGSAEHAEKFSYGLVNELVLTFSRQENTLSGSMIGGRVTDGIVPQPYLARVTLIPIYPGAVDIYISDDYDTLGDPETKFDGNFSATLTVGNRYAQVWTQDSENPSFRDHVELQPTVTLELQCLVTELDGFSAIRAGATKYIRVAASAAADAIEAGYTYEYEQDFAGQITGPGAAEDNSGAKVRTWTFTGVGDLDMGSPVRIRVRNDMASLLDVPPPLPPVPQGLEVADTSTTSLTATWAADQVWTDSFDLRYSLDEDAWTTITGVTSPKVIDTLSPATEYFVQIRAVNTTGTSEWTNSVAQTTKAE